MRSAVGTKFPLLQNSGISENRVNIRDLSKVTTTPYRAAIYNDYKIRPTTAQAAFGVAPEATTTDQVSVRSTGFTDNQKYAALAAIAVLIWVYATDAQNIF